MIDTKKIKAHLPRRYSKLLQARIEKKTGIRYSIIMIASCMADNPKRTNDTIIQEAVLWAQEIKAKKLETAEMMDAL